ncbi:MAG TPA: hypothetical protein VGD90_02160, partial [Sphingobacteriaceae bacterium]
IPSMKGEWTLIPLGHIFGSEELSVYTAGIQERMPPPYLALNQEDASRLEVVEGQELLLTVDSIEFRLPVKVIASLPMGCAGLPYNIQSLTGISWPAFGELRKEDL